MSIEVVLQINGQPRSLLLSEPVTLAQVIEALQMKADRIAVELNGEITSRKTWSSTPVAPGDKLEVVHFVGGGTCS